MQKISHFYDLSVQNVARTTPDLHWSIRKAIFSGTGYGVVPPTPAQIYKLNCYAICLQFFQKNMADLNSADFTFRIVRVF